MSTAAQKREKREGPVQRLTLDLPVSIYEALREQAHHRRVPMRTVAVECLSGCVAQGQADDVPPSDPAREP